MNYLRNDAGIDFKTNVVGSLADDSLANSWINFSSFSNKKRSLGMEIELLVLDSNFNEVHEADALIKQASLKGIKVEKECSESMVELISDPGSGNEITKQLASDYLALSEIAESIGLKILPIDYPLNNNFKPRIRSYKKYSIQKEILGDSFTYAGSVCGIHLHFDVQGNNTDILRINLLKLIDPLIVSISSTTSNFYNGKFVQNWRLLAYRSFVYKDFKHHGGVTPLTKTFDDFVIQMNTLTNSFKQSYSGSEDINNYVLPLKGVWGSLRLKPEIPTIELRSAGSVPDFNFISLFSKFFERFDYLIANNDFDLDALLIKLYKTNNFLEVSNRLDLITNLSIVDGLKSSEIRSYVETFLSFFKDDLLSSLFQKLIDGKRSRDEIVQSSYLTIAEKYSLLHDLSIRSSSELLDDRVSFNNLIKLKTN